MDIRSYNRAAWDRQVAKGNRWTVPVGPDAVARARSGNVEILLTPVRVVPAAWLGSLRGREVLALASGGGQQAPLLAAAGARVTLLDNSPAQLAQDRSVAERESLEIRTIEGDMADLSMLADASFDLIVHPCSNMFVPDVRPVWREAFRVLRPGGAMLAGFFNPAFFIFDPFALERGEFIVRHALPYADITSLTEEERERFVAQDEPLVFGHTLEQLIGGQLEAGFSLVALFEDGWPENALAKYTPVFIATRAVKPGKAGSLNSA
jgi:SAM-dependent methyltransferase